MIGFLAGQPRLVGDSLLVMVGGVGYTVHAGPQTLSQVTPKNNVELYIHTHVREDRLELYGFVELQQRALFLMLLDVSGVGPRTAMVISDQPANQLVGAVQQADTAFFTQLPRVGKKLAQKIIIELRSKLGEIESLNLAPLTSQQQTVSDALQQLGFTETAVTKVMAELPIDELSLNEAVKQALQKLGQKHV